MIQIITYDTSKYKEYPETIYKISKLGEIQALDDFEICIIDLSSKLLWEYNGTEPINVNCYKDLLTIREAIINSKRTKMVIVLPQNEKISYNKTYEYTGNSKHYYYTSTVQLKDNKNNMLKIIKDKLFEIAGIGLSFEKTKTNIGNKSIDADFNFVNYIENQFEVITISKSSKKATSIRKNNVILTTLKILDNIENIREFINNYCKEEKEKEEIPEWINNIKFFNDEQLSQEKSENIKMIEKLEEENEKLDKQLEKNLEYKSILYTNSDELVKVVLEILDEILEYDSSGFEDEKKEDFLIKKGDVTFVGEIKGLSSAAKNENVSQLEVHIQRYFDKIQEEGKEENVKGLLIINHQRNKPLEERQKVHQNQIDLATKYGVLIVETSTLLKIYEKYKLGEFTKEECKKLFVNNIGLLKI